MRYIFSIRQPVILHKDKIRGFLSKYVNSRWKSLNIRDPISTALNTFKVIVRETYILKLFILKQK